MSRIAVISYGMSDTIIPLLKHYALQPEAHEVTLFMMYAQNKKMEGIVNFGSVPVDNGFVPEERTEELLGKGILRYVGDSFRIRIFVYNDLKFKSLKNGALSLRLIGELRKYDLIHVNGTDGTLLQLLPFLETKKWIASVHDFNPHSGEGRRSAKTLEDFLFGRAHHLIIQNQADYRYVERHYPKLFPKTAFIPFGYIDVYKSFLGEGGLQDKNCDILFFGRLSQYKGVEYLLDALDLLAAKGLRPRVIIAGSGRYDFGRERLKAMENVEFINQFIDNGDLAELVAGAKVVVCPYTDATQSGVLMTAFAFHKPVIATAVGGFRDVIIDGVNGFLVPPKAADPLAAAMETLLTNPERREAMAEKIRRRTDLEQYRWDRIAGQLQAVYNQFD